jgi:hypothetical protein
MEGTFFLKNWRTESSEWSDRAYADEPLHSEGVIPYDTADVGDKTLDVIDIKYVFPKPFTPVESNIDWIAAGLLYKHRAHRVKFDEPAHKGGQRIGYLGKSAIKWIRGLQIKRPARLIEDFVVAADVSPMESEVFEVQPYRPPLAEALHEKIDASEFEELGDLLEILLQVSPNELEHWIFENFSTWLVEGRIALAAVIEAAVRRNVPSIHNIIAETLQYKSANPAVASVAAQRLRRVQFPNEQSKSNLWPAVQFWIEAWMRGPTTEKYAIQALPSVLYLAHPSTGTWLASVIESAPPRLADAGAIGILDWARLRTETASAETARVLTNAILARFDFEIHREPREHELVGTLVWVVGATVAENQLSEVVKILADCFQRPTWAEDAAAVRAGRILYGRFKRVARQLIAEAMGGLESDICQRYEMALMHRMPFPVFPR